MWGQRVHFTECWCLTVFDFILENGGPSAASVWGLLLSVSDTKGAAPGKTDPALSAPTLGAAHSAATLPKDPTHIVHYAIS